VPCTASRSAVGLLIAFRYALTGFACVWFFRRDLPGRVRALVLKGMLPAVGGVALLAASILSISSYWPAASSYLSFVGVGGIFLIGAGLLVVGVVGMLVVRSRMPAFFVTGTLPPLLASGRAGRGDLARSAVVPRPTPGSSRGPCRVLDLA
jgi:hypothetical protein